MYAKIAYFEDLSYVSYMGHVSALLTAARRDRAMTLADLAQKAFVGESTVRSVCAGQHETSLITALSLSRALGVRDAVLVQAWAQDRVDAAGFTGLTVSVRED